MTNLPNSSFAGWNGRGGANTFTGAPDAPRPQLEEPEELERDTAEALPDEETE